MTHRTLHYKSRESKGRVGPCPFMVIAALLTLLSMASLIGSFLMLSSLLTIWRRLTNAIVLTNVADVRAARWSTFITITLALCALTASILAMMFGRAKTASSICLFICVGILLIAYIDLIV